MVVVVVVVMVVMVIWMHLVLVNNNITASSSDEKTLFVVSSLYLRAYSLDGVSIGTVFFFFFPLFASFFLLLLVLLLHESFNIQHTHIYSTHFSSPFSYSSSRAFGRSMLDDGHFACNLHCLLRFFFSSPSYCSLVKLTFSFLFSSLAFERPHIHTSQTIYLICARQLHFSSLSLSLSLLLFPILCSLAKCERVLFDFSFFSFALASTERLCIACV